MKVLERIACTNFVETDGYAYFSGRYYNGLYKSELETGKTIFLRYFEDERLARRNIHKEIFLRKNKIYMCPWKGSHVHIWDLSNQILTSVQIRSEEKEIFFIDEVILGEKSVFLVPDREGFPVKKMNLESLKVTEINTAYEIQGECMSETRDIFPVPRLLEAYHIEYTDQFFWKKISEKGWYAFQLLGRHILHYTEGQDRLEIIPLTVVNKPELDEHLRKVRKELLDESLVGEGIIEISELLDDIKPEEKNRATVFRKNIIGQKIWESVKTDNRK